MAVVLAALGIIPMANLVTTGGGLPWWNAAVLQWIVALVIVGFVAGAAGAAFPEQIERLGARACRLVVAPSPLLFSVAVAALTMVLSLYFGRLLFAFEPVAGDEFAQRWQGHLIAYGRLYASAESHPEFFSTAQTLEIGGRWFSQFPVGWPALLAVGEIARVSWLINPLLAGVATIAFYRLVSALSDDVTARTTTLLFMLTPFLLFMAGSQMNHVATLAFVLIALASVPPWRASGDARAALFPALRIGGALGLVATIRPFDAFVAACVIGVIQLRHVLREHWRVKPLLFQCLAGSIPVLVLMAANYATTGHAFSFAYDVLNGPEHRPGFHMTPLGFEHTPLRALYMASAYLMKLDVGLFAWPVPAVLLVVITLLMQRTMTEWDAMLIALLGGLLVGYAVYWSESYFLGPRFLFLAIPVLVYYTGTMTGVIRQRAASPRLRAATLLLIPLWLAAAWLAPLRSSQAFGVRQLAETYRMKAAAPVVLDEAKRLALSNALVFIPEGWHGRLTARLRATGMRPLAAERVVAEYDACSLQEALDRVERMPGASAAARTQFVLNFMERSAPARPLASLSPNEQIALIPGGTLPPACESELAEMRSLGLSLAGLLPYIEIDERGALDGNIVYARDFGPRNELLRPRFGNRVWHVVRPRLEGGVLRVSIEPYQRPAN